MNFFEQWALNAIRATHAPKDVMVTLMSAKKMSLVELTALKRSIRYRLFLQLSCDEGKEEPQFICGSDWDQAKALHKLLQELS